MTRTSKRARKSKAAVDKITNSSKENEENGSDVEGGVQSSFFQNLNKIDANLKRTITNLSAALDASDDDTDKNNEEEEVVEKKRKRSVGRPKKLKVSSEEESSQDKENKGGRGKKTKQNAVLKTPQSTTKKNKNSTDSDDESETDGNDYEVQKIIDVYFKKNGSREFLVRWKGYTSSDDTWEPEEHLNCPELINKLMEKVEKAKNSSEKELREKPQRKTVVVNHKKYSFGRQLRNNGFRPFYQE